MPEYNFLNLSPAEFEELTRDLLQKKFDIYLESFTNGRDGGIDFRACFPKNREMVIQCKRYQDYESLFSKLKIEVSKLQKLKPKRYVLCTSAPLTPLNKKNITTLLSPYIKSSTDIFGRDDLNNLLGMFPLIEKQHFKLWISGTNIMSRILHSRIYNQSSFEEDHINEIIKLYVNNKSYSAAKDLIDKFNYVIISGTPGIGKSTLARVLSYYYLANGYEEFIFLSESIDDAFTIYNEDAKQIFLFDDFLGKSFLGKQLKNNEEQRIVKFIDKISKSSNKILILTTREYILAQAKLRFDIFETDIIDLSKCVIDLEQYTKIVRAKILYNHLYFADIGEEYIKQILVDKNYYKIITHPNYNPRIIEIVTKPKILRTIPSEDFFNKFLEFLDYPESIWKHVYENQITTFSQVILANMMTMGTPAHLNHLKRQVKSFANENSTKYGFTYTEIDFNKCLKELENTFIRTSTDSIENFLVDYMNPSVQDFLISYFKEMPDFLSDVLESAVFFNQFFVLFEYKENKKAISGDNVGKILLNQNQCNIVANRIIDFFEHFLISTVKKYSFVGTNNYQFQLERVTTYSKIDMICRSGMVERVPELEKSLVIFFQSAILPIKFEGDDFRNYIVLFEKFQKTLKYEPFEVLKTYSKHIMYLDNFNDFTWFKDILPDAFERFVTEDAHFMTSIKQIAEQEVEYTENEDYEVLIDNLHTLEKETGLNMDMLITEMELKLEESKKNAGFDYDDYEEHDRYHSSSDGSEPYTDISDMFDSLR